MVKKMNEKISLLIKENYSLINNIKLMVINNIRDESAVELLSVLKINELILLELKYRINHKEPKTVLKSLEKMKVNLSVELIRTS